jgi:hypothetical protein
MILKSSRRSHSSRNCWRNFEMKYQSIIEARSTVEFPEFLAERVYMREFYKGKLPEDLKRWEPTVDAMLDGVDTDGPIYIMIDEKVVKAGEAQRRRGLHVDGYWNPVDSKYGGPGAGYGSLSAHGGGHLPAPSGHGGGGGGHGGMDHVWIDKFVPLKKKKSIKRPVKKASSWETATFEAPEGIILASSVSAAMGYTGEFEGVIGDGGDCSHIDISGLSAFRMMSNQVYAGNVCCLHESIPVEQDCLRSLVRLNVKGWTPQ